MRAFTRASRGEIAVCLLLLWVTLIAASGCSHRGTSPPKVDPSARLEERRQRSVTEDTAVMDKLPNDWLVPAAAQTGVQQYSPEETEESEIAEFVERFKNSTPKVVQSELSPGATSFVELQLAGPSGLAGSAQWIGTSAPLKVTIAVNGAHLATGTTYRVGSKHGGSRLQAQTPVGGRATIAVTNTSSVRVKVRILLLATSL